MSSAYKGLDLFGSGPHRFAEGRRGQALVSELGMDPPGPGSRYWGLLEASVVVSGRLAGASESQLWSRVDALLAQVIDPPVPGVLRDVHGREWDEMSLVRVTLGDRVDRGRVWSVAYRARFLRLRVYPQ